MKLTEEQQEQWNDSVRPLLERARKVFSQPSVARFRGFAPAAVSRDEIIESIDRDKAVALVDRCMPPERKG